MLRATYSKYSVLHMIKNRMSDLQRGKIKTLWSNITIEPLIFLFLIIKSLTQIATDELYLQKTCQVNLKYSPEVCSNLTQHDGIQKETQNYAASVQVLALPLTNLS